ncbi:hypothetical protein OSB04_031771 [Centaurea solstitialis]|uniref:DUF4283 domain-containing protein n=1 Tax=Centaurea solstitialis TaxID=347529 RepID=A0AA38SB13_9ASTR|nr:hypothetical protein OSB04_031771 [Centaurea solstitialis]
MTVVPPVVIAMATAVLGAAEVETTAAVVTGAMQSAAMVAVVVATIVITVMVAVVVLRQSAVNSHLFRSIAAGFSSHSSEKTIVLLILLRTKPIDVTGSCVRWRNLGRTSGICDCQSSATGGFFKWRMAFSLDVGDFGDSSSRLSFATVVGEKSNTGLEFFPLKDRKASSIAIPIDLAREAAKAYHTTIVGYFLGSRIPFPIVHRCLRNAWGKFGFNDVMMNNNGFFFIKFNDKGGSTRALEEGMIMIRNAPLFVGPWDPSKGLTRPSHYSCPLWVKFHNVPLVLFNPEGISRIASALGVPK